MTRYEQLAAQIRQQIEYLASGRQITFIEGKC